MPPDPEELDAAPDNDEMPDAEPAGIEEESPKNDEVPEA